MEFKRSNPFALKNQALEEGWSLVQIFPWGKIVYQGMPELYDDTFFDSLMNDFQKQKSNYENLNPGHEFKVPFDYNHGLAMIDPNPEQGKAAGSIYALRKENGKGLFAKVKWTKPALEYIRNEEYLFVSPHWAFEEYNAETGMMKSPSLIAVALTNRPAFKTLPAIAASAQKRQQQPTKEGVHMREEIAKALGMVEKTDNEVIEKVKSLGAEVSQSTEKLKAAGLEIEKLKTSEAFLSEELKKANETLQKIKSEKEADDKANFDKEVVDTIAQVDKDGKFEVEADVRAAEMEALKTNASKYGIEFFRSQVAIISMRKPRIEVGKSIGLSSKAEKPTDVEKTKLVSNPETSLADYKEFKSKQGGK